MVAGAGIGTKAVINEVYVEQNAMKELYAQPSEAYRGDEHRFRDARASQIPVAQPPPTIVLTNSSAPVLQ